MITLYNVIDTRTNSFYSVAIVSEKNARWFIPVLQEEPPVEEVSEEVETPAVSGLSDESQEMPNEEGDSV